MTGESIQDDTLKAIPTTYGDVVFRSRLEARWAVFFDSMGLRWAYEPEGFILPSGERYLPDFKVQDIGWLEIKPLIKRASKLFDDEIDAPHYGGSPFFQYDKPTMYSEFAETTDEPYFIIHGQPGSIDCDWETTPDYYAACYQDSPYFFTQCSECNAIGLTYNCQGYGIRHANDCTQRIIRAERLSHGSTEKLKSAYTLAASAKFPKSPWERYEEVKAEWLRKHGNITPEQYEQYIRAMSSVVNV